MCCVCIVINIIVNNVVARFQSYEQGTLHCLKTAEAHYCLVKVWADLTFTTDGTHQYYLVWKSGNVSVIRYYVKDVLILNR